jgi:hypothetical protein
MNVPLRLDKAALIAAMVDSVPEKVEPGMRELGEMVVELEEVSDGICVGDGQRGAHCCMHARDCMVADRQVRRRWLVVRVLPRPNACAGAPIERGSGRSEVTTKPDLKGKYLLAATCLVTS